MSLNFLAIICGPPEHGKTSLAADVIRQRLDDGWWIFAHDVNEQFAHLCKSYTSTDAWRAAAREAASGNKPMPRGASFRCKASEVVALCNELGELHNRAKAVRFPMLLAFDEGSLLDGSGSTHIGDDDNELIANRRHRGIGLLYNVQRRTQLTQAFWDLATDLYLLAQPEKRVAELEEIGHLKAGTLAGLVALPPFRYAHVKPGRGLQ